MGDRHHRARLGPVDPAIEEEMDPPGGRQVAQIERERVRLRQSVILGQRKRGKRLIVLPDEGQHIRPAIVDRRNRKAVIPYREQLVFRKRRCNELLVRDDLELIGMIDGAQRDLIRDGRRQFADVPVEGVVHSYSGREGGGLVGDVGIETVGDDDVMGDFVARVGVGERVGQKIARLHRVRVIGFGQVEERC